ncbi:MAG TPA: choice-of-anchor tandem repeat GloVer-containing protein, partial [Candidatus Sulfotelmatobacter sp.]|nr:choice-of-anchor tandem repeat GloVer-containing protein [Candidatus Sulfotelmatobacter sp.]
MPAKGLSFASRGMFVPILVMLAVNALAARPAEHLLYSFPFSSGAPNGGLVADSAGNLYGTTRAGGNGSGTVFELSPPAAAGGSWTESVLYAFNSNGINDGSMPYSTLIFDKLGNL